MRPDCGGPPPRVGTASAKDPLSFGIDGLAEGDTIYLANYYGNKMYYADTATVGKKGRFDFVSPTPDKGGKYGLVLPGNAFVEFIVTGEPVSLTADAANLPGSVEVQEGEDHGCSTITSPSSRRAGEAHSH